MLFNLNSLNEKEWEVKKVVQCNKKLFRKPILVGGKKMKKEAISGGFFILEKHEY